MLNKKYDGGNAMTGDVIIAAAAHCAATWHYGSAVAAVLPACPRARPIAVDIEEGATP